MSKHIKQIIHYISDEMSLSERESFEALLAEGGELYREYDTIKQIWEFLAEKLRIAEKDEIEDMDSLVAEVLAEHDLKIYSDAKASAKEKAFVQLISQKPEPGDEPTITKNKSPRLVRLSVILAAAALLLLLLLPGKDLQTLVQSFNMPQQDKLLSEIPGVSRSAERNGVYYFLEAQYGEALDAFESALPGPINHEKVMYGISLHETGNTSKSIEILEVAAMNTDQQWKEIASWYLALYLIESDKQEAALPYLLELREAEGAYSKKAGRILRRLVQ